MDCGERDKDSLQSEERIGPLATDFDLPRIATHLCTPLHTSERREDNGARSAININKFRNYEWEQTSGIGNVSAILLACQYRSLATAETSRI